jgi:hypothetical protein
MRSFRADEQADALIEEMTEQGYTVTDVVHRGLRLLRERRGMYDEDQIRREIQELRTAREELLSRLDEIDNEIEAKEQLLSRADELHVQEVLEVLSSLTTVPVEERAQYVQDNVDLPDGITTEDVVYISETIGLHFRSGKFVHGDYVDEELKAAGYSYHKDLGEFDRVEFGALRELYNGLTPREEREARKILSERF